MKRDLLRERGKQRGVKKKNFGKRDSKQTGKLAMQNFHQVG